MGLFGSIFGPMSPADKKRRKAELKEKIAYWDRLIAGMKSHIAVYQAQIKHKPANVADQRPAISLCKANIENYKANKARVKEEKARL